MKKIILSTSIIIITTLGISQEPISFRSNALGGIINDDLDLIYDPIELRFVGRINKLSGNGIYDEGEEYTDLGNNIYDEGESFEDQNANGIYDSEETFEDIGNGIYDDGEPFIDLPERNIGNDIRLYTNLSNLTSTQEQIFDNKSDDELLFGISLRNPFVKFLWHSALFRFQNSKISNPVSIYIDGLGYIYGEGNLEDVYVALLDTNYNGSYDLRKSYTQSKSNIPVNDSYYFSFNNTISLSHYTIGAKISIGNEIISKNTASAYLGSYSNVLSGSDLNDPTFSNSFTTWSLHPDYMSLFWTERGDFNNQNKVNFTNLDLSVMLPLRGFELRADLGIYSNQTLNNINDSYYGQYEYWKPTITNYNDEYQGTDTYYSKNDIIGNETILGGSIRKTFNKQKERKNDGFWSLYASYNHGVYTYTLYDYFIDSRYEEYFDGHDTLYTDVIIEREYADTTSDGGTMNTHKYLVNYYLNIPLEEKAHFGIGGFFRHNKSQRYTDYMVLTENIVSYVYTDTLNTNDSDYVITSTALMNAYRNINNLDITFTCPVGLEYNIGKQNNWSLRFGAIFTFNFQELEDIKKIAKSEPYTTITEYPNSIETDITDNVYVSTTEQTLTKSSSTVFTYGIGYNPFDYLQIDLLGIGSDDFEFDGVRLSFTMKF